MALGQVTLFGHDEPAVEATLAGMQRIALGDGAWLDYLPQWLTGHAAVFDALAASTRCKMYDRVVDVPRTWQHSLPKVKRADPRIAIMFRPVWQEAKSPADPN